MNKVENLFFLDFLHYTIEKHNVEFEWPSLSGLSAQVQGSGWFPNRLMLQEKT